MESVLEIQDLTVAYDDKPVLWDLDLEIPRSRLVAIIGPNGAGKTTFIKAALGLIKPVSGTVRFFGKKINRKELHRQVAYVPQSASVDWDFPTTVLDVVMMGRYGHLGLLKRPGKKEQAMARETLAKVGMLEFAQRQISQLSGGQQQRVFLARALVQEAEIYLLDEPFKGVDAKTEKVVVELLKELQAQGRTVIVVHHDLRTVESYFDWAVFLNRKIIACGPVREVFNQANLEKAYKGKIVMESGDF